MREKIKSCVLARALALIAKPTLTTGANRSGDVLRHKKLLESNEPSQQTRVAHKVCFDLIIIYVYAVAFSMADLLISIRSARLISAM